MEAPKSGLEKHDKSQYVTKIAFIVSVVLRTFIINIMRFRLEFAENSLPCYIIMERIMLVTKNKNKQNKC